MPLHYKGCDQQNKCPSGCQLQMAQKIIRNLRDEHWCQYCAATSGMTGRMAPSALPVVLCTIESQEEWLIKHTIP